MGDYMNNFAKGIFVAIVFGGAAYLFASSVPPVIDLIANFKAIIAGQYEFEGISSSTFYAFWGYAVTLTLVFNLAPTEEKARLTDNEE